MSLRTPVIRDVLLPFPTYGANPSKPESPLTHVAKWRKTSRALYALASGDAILVGVAVFCRAVLQRRSTCFCSLGSPRLGVELPSKRWFVPKIMLLRLRLRPPPTLFRWKCDCRLDCGAHPAPRPPPTLCRWRHDWRLQGRAPWFTSLAPRWLLACNRAEPTQGRWRGRSTSLALA